MTDKNNQKNEPKVEYKKVEVVDETAKPSKGGSQDKRPSVMPFSLYVQNVLWAGIGALITSVLSVVGVAMMAYGFSRTLGQYKEAKRNVGVLLSACAGIAIPLLFGAQVLQVIQLSVLALLYIGVAWIIAYFMQRKHVTVTVDYAVALGGSLFVGLCLAVYLAITNLSLTAFVSSIARPVQESLQGVLASYGLDVSSGAYGSGFITSMITVGLPAILFIYVGVCVLGAHFGARMAKPFMPGKTWNLEQFDAPTWSMIAVIVAILACVFGGFWMPLFSVGVSALVALRFIYLMQGIAVISFWFRKYRLGCLLRFVIIFLAVELESAFFVLTIIGIIDFFANFRKLNRANVHAHTKRTKKKKH